MKSHLFQAELSGEFGLKYFRRVVTRREMLAGTAYTCKWFAWTNTLFSELIVKLSLSRGQLLPPRQGLYGNTVALSDKFESSTNFIPAVKVHYKRLNRPSIKLFAAALFAGAALAPLSKDICVLTF